MENQPQQGAIWLPELSICLNVSNLIKLLYNCSILLVTLPSMNKPNDACPGTATEQAGKADACAGCPNQTICSTNEPVIDPDIALIANKLKGVKHKILVLSGKGG